MRQLKIQLLATGVLIIFVNLMLGAALDLSALYAITACGVPTVLLGLYAIWSA